MAPSFFGYRSKVFNELRRQGHDVECIDDRPSESTLFRSLAKIGYGLVDSGISDYAEQIRRRVALGEYDLLLYMGGMSFCFTRDQFAPIRKVATARFVAYLWDSFGNCQRFGSCKDYFDDIYSFEPDDCVRFGLQLRPLFFSEEYSAIPFEPEEGFLYDACFIGSVHQPSKFKMVSSICSGLEREGRKVFKYFYMPSISVALLRRCTDSAYRHDVFQFSPLSTEQVVDIYAHSKVIIDSPQANQNGLTMRTLETVGARRKLITANSDVSSYDFARAGNVTVWCEGKEIPDEFFDSPYGKLPKEVHDSYSLAAFVRALLGEGGGYSGYKRGNR